MAQNPAFDLAAHLAGAVTLLSPPGGGPVTLTVGTNLFVGPVRESDAIVPAQAVFAINAGGPQSEPYLPSTSGSWRRAFVRVQVRSALDDFSGGEALARGCWSKVYLAAVAGYVWSKPLSSEVDFDGQDERGLFMFSFTVELAYATTS